MGVDVFESRPNMGVDVFGADVMTLIPPGNNSRRAEKNIVSTSTSIQRHL